MRTLTGQPVAAETIKAGLVTISYAPADSQYARSAARVLAYAYEEITFDLQIVNSDTLRVIIAPSRKKFFEYTRGQLPKWTGAFATPGSRTMVVKSPRWGREGKDFSGVLVHELVHLLIHEKVRGRPVPRWLDEGLAIFYSGETRWKTMTALSKAAATNSLIPLQDIDWVLRFNRIKAELAYQESYSAVRYLLSVYDIDAIRIILDGIRQGRDMDKSFREATGSTFRDFELEWQQYAKKTFKWFWLSDINDFFWVFILVLAILAAIVIRIRNRRKVHEWEEWGEGE